jgi:hypothetical protein
MERDAPRPERKISGAISILMNAEKTGAIRAAHD